MLFGYQQRQASHLLDWHICKIKNYFTTLNSHPTIFMATSHDSRPQKFFYFQLILPAKTFYAFLRNACLFKVKTKNKNKPTIKSIQQQQKD